MADALDLLVRAVALPVSALLTLNGLDDLFIDLNFYFRRLFAERDRRLTVEELKKVKQKRIAMLVPAWHEDGVIQRMLELNLRTIDYSPENFDIFVGTYPNDPATQERVDAVARKARNVHKVVTPHPGPTNKADNLNWVYQGIKLLEEQQGRRFDILLMHDAEDLIHPLSLRLYNYFIPEYDFLQTPVFPLEVPWHKLVAGTYLDEFTEHHLKDMLVRAQIGGLVPSAGVGSAFARDSFEEIAFAHSQVAFNPLSLTEDYDIGLKFRLAGKKTRFLTRAVARLVKVQRGIFRKRTVTIEADELIATREYFPDTFRTAVRQRSRWVLGISLQTWSQLGWPGSLAVRYCLWRDRKSLLIAYVGPLGYFIAAYCLVRFVAGLLLRSPWTFESVFVPGSLLWYLVIVNTGFLLWRALMKYVCVDTVYGPKQALLAIPRFLVGSMVNLFATSRAVWQWIDHKITGVPVRWVKTTHAFPSVEALRSYHRQLGDLLLEREGITEADLEEALRLQDATGLKLGEVCTEAGLVPPGEVVEALGAQLSLELVEPNPYRIPTFLLERLPEADARRMSVLPLDVRPDQAVVVATAAPPTQDTKDKLEDLLGARVAFVFCLADTLELARDRAYRRLASVSFTEQVPMGEELVAGGWITREQLDEVFRERTDVAEPLGERLVRLGLVPADAVSQVLERRLKARFRRLLPGMARADLLGRIGYGACALYGMVPVRSPEGNRVQMASSHPLHVEVLTLCQDRVGEPIEPVLAPRLDVRLLLSLASLEVWPGGMHLGASGLDGAELAAIAARPDLRALLGPLRESARRQAKSPIACLEASGRIDAATAAWLRARALGIPVVPATGTQRPPAGLLPPELDGLDIRLVASNPDGLVLATPRPGAQLARRLSALLPGTPIAWRVALDPHAAVATQPAGEA